MKLGLVLSVLREHNHLHLLLCLIKQQSNKRKKATTSTHQPKLCTINIYYPTNRYDTKSNNNTINNNKRTKLTTNNNKHELAIRKEEERRCEDDTEDRVKNDVGHPEQPGHLRTIGEASTSPPEEDGSRGGESQGICTKRQQARYVFPTQQQTFLRFFSDQSYFADTNTNKYNKQTNKQRTTNQTTNPIYNKHSMTTMTTTMAHHNHNHHYNLPTLPFSTFLRQQ